MHTLRKLPMSRPKSSAMRASITGSPELAWGRLAGVPSGSGGLATRPGTPVGGVPSGSRAACQAGLRRFEPRLPLHLFNHFHTSPNQLLSHLSQLDADGSDLKALKSDQSAATASRFRAIEVST